MDSSREREQENSDGIEELDEDYPSSREGPSEDEYLATPNS